MPTTQQVVDVAAAVIEQPDGSFLLAQRPRGKVYEGYWEFPGGKVEHGEPIADALDRELHEELGIGIELAYPWITRIYSYEHATVKLHFYRVVRWRGDPHAREGQALSWQQNNGKLTVSPVLPANAPVLKALSLPRSIGITCAWELGIEAALDRLKKSIGRGLRLVQVRENNLAQDARRNFAARVTKVMCTAGGIVMINRDAPLAKSLGTGLHLPSRELMATNARPDFEWCSASCHNVAEMEKAQHLALDFVLLGPVDATPSHAGMLGLGWNKVADLIRHYQLPVFALGGMRLANLHEARSAGAHGVAMVRGAWELD